MGFGLREISNFLGRPVCLYEFAWGGTIYRYTSASRKIQWGLAADGVTPLQWEPLAISDTGFTQGASAQDFIVTLPRSTPVVDLFRATPPSTKIVLTCRRFHFDDTDQQAVVYWVGTVGNVKGKDAVTAEVLGLPISSTVRRTGLRLCWEVNCPHALYDQGCKANKALFKTDTTITALTGKDITVASLGAWPGARYAGGFVEWQATPEGTLDRRPIESFVSGTTLRLLSTTDRLVLNQPITLYLGCDLTAETCETVFNNLPNHGGFPFMAKKSPFDGNPVF